MKATRKRLRWIRVGVWVCAVSSAWMFSGERLLGAGPAPTIAGDAGQAGKAPAGWFLAGSKPANYRTGVDRDVVQEDRASAYLTSALPKTDGFGTLMQSIRVTKYAGKRVRLRAWLSSRDVDEWAGLWMRVDRGQAVVAFDNMQSRPITKTQGWRTHDVVLDVPEDATGISFGVLLTGAGEVWANHVTFEVVGKETAVTSADSKAPPPLPTSPVNLDFTE